MSFHPFTTFSSSNRRLILLLVASHLVWSGAVIGLWSVGRLFDSGPPWW